jgi:hypothetical protein
MYGDDVGEGEEWEWVGKVGKKEKGEYMNK